MKNNIEFISYSGTFPCLCYGTLKIKVNNKIYKLKNILSSGGSVWFDDTWGEHVEQGPWKIEEEKLPEELKPYIKEIEEIVNGNVEYGCCGGCV